MPKTESTDIVLEAGAPNLAEWLAEFQLTVSSAASTTFRRAESTRYCLWDGQSHDGRKHAEDIGDEAIPWEGARDGRYFQADFICKLMSAICVQGMLKAKLSATPKGMDDAPKAQYVNAILDHYRAVMRSNSDTELRLFAQWVNTYGVAVLQAGWEEEITRFYQPITMDDISAMAQKDQPGGPIASMLAFIQDTDQEGAALDIAKLYFQDTPNKLLRKSIRELRATGETRLPRQRTVRRAPFLRSLQVYDDVFFPPETTSLAKARWIAVRVFLSKVDLEEKVITEDWDSDWVDLVCASALGKRSLNYAPKHPARLDDAGWTVAEDSASKLAEVVYLYRRRIDSNGVPELDLTVCCPHVLTEGTEEVFAWDGVLDDANGQYPFVVGQREHVSRRILDSRGVPEIAASFQAQGKAFSDACSDRLGLEVVPPFQCVGGRVPKRMMPGQAISVQRIGEISPLLLTSGNPTLGFELLRTFDRFLSAYFGIFHPEVPQPLTLLMMQETVSLFLSALCQGHKLVTRCVMGNATPEELERIAGPPPENFNRDDVDAMYDVELTFDVGNMDPETVWAKIKAIAEGLLPIDVGGVIDRDKLVALALESIDHQAAKFLIKDQQGASQAMYNKVMQDTALMALGNEVAYTENDPTAGRKLEYLQRIMQSNPKYQENIQGDERFKALMENYAKNLQQSQVQLGENKQIGRTGVRPVDAAPQAQ